VKPWQNKYIAMEAEQLHFKKITGEPVMNVEQYVKDWIKENPYGKVTIGCDSQAHGRKIKYSVAICMLFIDKMGGSHGAHVISADIETKRNIKYKRGKAGAMEEMPAKLWKEAELVIQAASIIDANDETFKKRITIHLDYNVNAMFESNMLFASGIGYITGLGYHAEGKPHAWAATHVADALCR